MNDDVSDIEAQAYKRGYQDAVQTYDAKYEELKNNRRIDIYCAALTGLISAPQPWIDQYGNVITSVDDITKIAHEFVKSAPEEYKA